MKRRIGLALTALAVTALSPTPAPTEDIAERSLLDNDRVAVVEYTLPPGFRGEEHAAIANELAYVIDGEFSVVTAGKGSDAKLVLVDGQVAYRDGRFPKFTDGRRAIAEAERLGRSIVEQAGLGHRFSTPWQK